MAKPTILKDRHTGEEMYPHTLASLVQTSDGHNVDEGLEKAKFALFIDQWNAAWKVNNVAYGKYDPDNAPDPEHPFFGNKLWMTYEEALRVMAATQVPGGKALNMAVGLLSSNDMRARTVRPIRILYGDTNSLFSFANGNNTIEVIRLLTSNKIVVSDLRFAFSGCVKLREIIGELWIRTNTQGLVIQTPFGSCVELEEVRIFGLCKDLLIKDSSKLSLASLQFMVTNAANTAAITITVHKDVYAKLTGDTTNEAAAALTPEELAQWQQVLADAVAKNISFATL